jgi:hypothetical protein
VIEHVGAAAGKAPEDAVYQAANTPEAIAREHVAYQQYAQSRLASDVERLAETSLATREPVDVFPLVNVA